jgi:hypothetical protein
VEDRLGLRQRFDPLLQLNARRGMAASHVKRATHPWRGRVIGSGLTLHCAGGKHEQRGGIDEQRAFVFWTSSSPAPPTTLGPRPSAPHHTRLQRCARPLLFRGLGLPVKSRGRPPWCVRRPAACAACCHATHWGSHHRPAGGCAQPNWRYHNGSDRRIFVLVWLQGIDLKAGGRNKRVHRTAPKSDNPYLKLLVKVRAGSKQPSA